MKGGRIWASALTGLLLVAAACTGPTASNSQTSPSTAPSENPVSVPSAAPSPSPEPSPTGSTLAIASLPVHNGEVGVGYLAVSFKATGGTAPYTWAVETGTVPPGLALSGAGVLGGKNTTAGNYSFGVKVTDQNGQEATSKATIKVFAPLTVSQQCSNFCTVGLGCTTCGRFGAVSGGAGPYHYKVVNGALPTGMSLNGFALAGAWPLPNLVVGPPVDVIGPPILRPIWSLGVQVTDDFGVTKTVNANWFEFGPIQTSCSGAIQCSSLSNGVPDTSVTYAGGNPTDAVTVSVVSVCNIGSVAGCVTDAAGIAAALPNWSASAQNGTITVQMDCTNSPACPNGSLYEDVHVVLVDHGACVAPAYVQSTEMIFNIDV